MSDDICHFCGGISESEIGGHIIHTSTCVVTDRLHELRAQMDDFEKNHLVKMHSKMRVAQDWEGSGN